MKGKKERLEAEMENIPFPEHIFQGMDKKSVEFLKSNWSGNLEKFIDNCSKELKIEIGEYDPATGTIPYRKTD